MPAISIITIVYNGLPFLKECIESVFFQDFQDWELLISDDGSQDGSREYLQTIKDPRIRIFLQESNLGIFSNLNFVFNKAQAPISQILCQDDYFLDSNSLKKILNYWKNALPQTGFVRFNTNPARDKQLFVFEEEYLPKLILAGEADLWFFMFGNFADNLSNISLRTTLVKDSKGFDQRFPYAGDFEFWQRTAKNFNIGIQKEEITFIRRHPGVASNFLNRNGELIGQIKIIVTDLYCTLVKRYPYAKFALQLHGTLMYDSLMKDAGIKIFVASKRLTYLKTLKDHHEKTIFLFSEFFQWILYIISIGGRVGRTLSALYLLLKSKIGQKTI